MQWYQPCHAELPKSAISRSEKTPHKCVQKGLQIITIIYDNNYNNSSIISPHSILKSCYIKPIRSFYLFQLWHLFLFADANFHDFPDCSLLAHYNLSVYFGWSSFSLVTDDLASLEFTCKWPDLSYGSQVLLISSDLLPVLHIEVLIRTKTRSQTLAPAAPWLSENRVSRCYLTPVEQRTAMCLATKIYEYFKMLFFFFSAFRHSVGVSDCGIITSLL